MLIRNALTIVLSITLSVLATLFVDRHQRHQPSDVVRAKKIELVDDAGRVRGEFKLVLASLGREEPSLELLDDQGLQAVVLQLNHRGEGTLYFNSSRIREGIVSLGYLQFDDMIGPEDPMGGWGLKVQESETNITRMGLSNSGKPLGLSAPPGK